MNRFKTLLICSGLGQREAADFLGVNYSSIQKWVRGLSEAPDGVLMEMLPLAKRNADYVPAIEKDLKRTRR